MLDKKQFRIESKELMNLLINAVYSNPDIFLRELIANSSDACDKKYFSQFENFESGNSRDAFEIIVKIDERQRILSVVDNGIGMTEEELDDYLGRVAYSGTRALQQILKDKVNIEMIGQFGIGFYSAFLVSDKVEVITKRSNKGSAIKFTSEGMDGYTIEKTDTDFVGTIVNCYLKPDNKSFIYSRYLEASKIKGIIKKYSDYVRYSIVLNSSSHNEIVNDKVPIWVKNQADVTLGEYNDFYVKHFNDKNIPSKVISMNVDGFPSFRALLFIPSRAEKVTHNTEQNSGVQIYSKNNFVMNNANELFPSYLGFISGIIDSPDIGLGISRELATNDKNLEIIMVLLNI